MEMTPTEAQRSHDMGTTAEERVAIVDAVRDLRAHQILEGINEIMRVIIGRELLHARTPPSETMAS